jgi:putative glutamine amidotransferase
LGELASSNLGDIMNYPIIGITTMRSVNRYGTPLVSLAEAYVDALHQAGACPVLIPNNIPESALDELVSHLDGVVFSGGGDIDPGYYDAEDYPKVDGVEEQRDRVELSLLEKVVDEGKPFLGICRGIQLINVGLGGSLYADIADQVPGAAKHDYYPDWDRDHLAHTIRVKPETKLAEILGENEVEVNSLHHQAVEQLAADLIPTAYSPDGLIEGFELPGHPFGLAVQWHPEWLTAHKPMRTLFAAFIEAANSK